jgi:hypothetical protein
VPELKAEGRGRIQSDVGQMVAQDFQFIKTYFERKALPDRGKTNDNSALMA